MRRHADTLDTMLIDADITRLRRAMRYGCRRRCHLDADVTADWLPPAADTIAAIRCCRHVDADAADTLILMLPCASYATPAGAFARHTRSV